MAYFFAYGVSTDPERMQQEMGGYKSYQKAVLPDHACTFTYNPDYDGGATTLVQSQGDEALGVIYEIEESQLALFAEVDAEYALHKMQVQAGGELIEAYVLLPIEEETLTLPVSNYLERVRKGLMVHHAVEDVERYLQAGLARVTSSDRH
ncbi:hypothetical protein CIG75_14595 [Tumebacillus algifaecis]|uniref:Gamma-glutamylcyclotransferase AIG2-like domain-containing protein n=1 Tax=Tumebacillus algifaecis TaxID=1214604 RepID=A0A223D378_9BACL|nr:gamma-glutamylcyclotransferase family protein [Tumebacillus algifaecis]ASS76062.1 hypothetical protein CIG75_14595 [Tumebacillus algifaecis]